MSNNAILARMQVSEILRVIDPDPGGEIYELLFFMRDGSYKDYIVHMYHQQDCCEEVSLVDYGDILDMKGQLIEAEEITNTMGTDEGHMTHTFYKFRTASEMETLRWVGESNGYYSEEITLDIYEQSSYY
jgi:hypothetical protein